MHEMTINPCNARIVTIGFWQALRFALAAFSA
jgi:hypothetical protein